MTDKSLRQYLLDRIASCRHSQKMFRDECKQGHITNEWYRELYGRINLRIDELEHALEYWDTVVDAHIKAQIKAAYDMGAREMLSEISEIKCELEARQHMFEDTEQKIGYNKAMRQTISLLDELLSQH